MNGNPHLGKSSFQTQLFDGFLRSLGEADIGWSFPAFKEAWQAANLTYVCQAQNQSYIRNDEVAPELYMLDSFTVLLGTFVLHYLIVKHGLSYPAVES